MKHFKRAVLLLAAIGCTGWAHSKLPIASRSDLGEGFVPRPAVVSSMAFGFNALLADFYWLQAVQIIGSDSAVDAKKARHLGKLVDVVTTLNPNVGHPYRFAAVWLTQDDDLVREGSRLLRRAIENHPDDWRHYYYLGFNHFFYLFEYAEAASALEIAISLPDSPGYLPRLVARLKSHRADIDIAEVFLREILRTTENEETKTMLQIGLDEIEIEYKARHLDRARIAYVELSGRDIDVIEDLTRGPHRVLEKLPSAEPDALPSALTRGSVWEFDPETGRIRSSYIGSRYEVHYSGIDEERRKAWVKSQAGGQSSAEGA